MRAAAKLAAVGAVVAALAGCARAPLDTGNADMDYLHAQSWQAAQAMRGKEYIFVARAKVCPDQDAAALGPHLFNPLPHTTTCPVVTTGRFRVVDVVLMRNGTTLLQISGEGIAGYMPYEIFLPQPYKPVSAYFPDGEVNMADETVTLARYAAGLRYEDLPEAVVVKAKDIIADTVAACICGADMPWSRIVIDYAERTGPGGSSRILGRGTSVQAPAAALANGALGHSFELDSLTRPGAGAHPGATVLPPALAIAQQVGASGKALIAAVVAGNEVMIRIGRATGHTNEARGFHAPGTTGPFGAAVACGLLLGLDERQMTNAIGIAGSLAGGLLEFARGDGGMVKRLHLGRASEAGVMAASLAAGGFEAPRTVIEGEFGFLKVFCTEWDESHLTRGLGEDFVTMSAVLKRYPCHATAHAAVRAVRDLRAEHGFRGGEVSSITVTGTPRMVERHNIAEPPDLMLAQYSIPFCVALALYREARDPESYDQGALADRQIRALTRRVRLVAEEGDGHANSHGAGGSHVTVALSDGRKLERHEASGMLEAGELPDKFARLTKKAMGDAGAGLYERLMRLEDEASVDWLG